MAEAPKAGGGEARSGEGRAVEAARAGRGVIFIAFAKFYFMAAGFVLEVGLTRLLGNVLYGAYGVVNSLVSPFNNVLVTGTIQAVSRFASQRPDSARQVQRAGLRMHIYVGLVLAIAFAALAPVLARLQREVALTGPIMVAAIILAAYSFYAVFVGTANGLREFHKQAALDVGFSTLRVAGMIVLVSAGFGLYGAIGAWAGAACLILLISTFLVGIPRGAGGAQGELRPLVGFLIGVAVYLGLLNLIMVADQLLLKPLAATWFADHRAEALSAVRPAVPDFLFARVEQVSEADAASAQVGYYRAVQTLARLSYQAIIAGMFVVFPLVSRSTFQQDREATTGYIRNTMRYSFMFAMAIAVVMASNPAALLDIPYQADYAYFGGPALVALAFGNVAFSLFAIAGTILNGAGLTRHAIGVALVTLVAAAAANAIVIPMFVPGRALLTACAVATAGAMALGALASGIVLRRTLGAFLPLSSLVRVVIAALAAGAVGRAMPLSSPLGTLIEAAATGLVFLVALVLLRELGRADLAMVARVAGRRRT